MNKRDFLKASSLMAFSSLGNLKSLEDIIAPYLTVEQESLTQDESFWAKIRQGYDLPSDFINLENGYYCIQPREVLNAYKKHIETINRLGAYYMRTQQFTNKDKVVSKLSEVVGCNKENLIITRNTTESLNLIISGFHWQTGDEALFAYQDYGSMQAMFEQVQKRHGVVVKRLTIPNHPKNDEELVQLYENAITPKTKLLLLPHIINITGQILPVRKICDMAHSKGVQIMVDGAHAIAHFQFRIEDLNCDYYGSSLHKWLSTPLGAGLLYVKKELIPSVWPLFPEDNTAIVNTDIHYLNHTGTLPVHTDLAILNAIDYYTKLGAQRKENRLRYLQTYWTSKVRSLKNMELNTPQEEQRSCAIANVGITKYTPSELAELLFKKYKIYTVAINTATVKGCRITPNVYSTTAELDVLVKALNELAA